MSDKKFGHHLDHLFFKTALFPSKIPGYTLSEGLSKYLQIGDLEDVRKKIRRSIYLSYKHPAYFLIYGLKIFPRVFLRDIFKVISRTLIGFFPEDLNTPLIKYMGISFKKYRPSRCTNKRPSEHFF